MPRINEELVIDHFTQYLAGDKIEFLQDAPSEREKLIGYLEGLKGCGYDLHAKLEYGKKVWKLLFTHAMSFIDPDRRGYDRLFSMLDDYVEFEELMFASDPFYRDHTLHSLWVYFLGEYLFREPVYASLFKSYGDWLYGSAVHRQVFELIDFPLSDTPRMDPPIRCVAALCHDLGYPIRKIEKINQAIAKILPHFSINEHQKFNISYSPLQQSYLEVMSKMFGRALHVEKFPPTFYDSCRELGIDNPFCEKGVARLKQLPPEARRKISESFTPRFQITRSPVWALRSLTEMEEFNHGYLSVYLLTKFLPCFTSEYWMETESPQSIGDFSRVYALDMIMGAIFLHSTHSFTISKINSPFESLVFVDELEEFSRISRANQNRQYLNEFCQTAFELNDGWFELTFTFADGDPSLLDPERFFRDKATRFLRLFDIPNLDETLQIRLICQDWLNQGAEKNYRLELAANSVTLVVDGKLAAPGDYFGLVEFSHYAP